MDKEALEAQKVIQSIQNNQPAQPEVTSTMGGVCPQCGLLHPPLQPGEKCPNVALDGKDNLSGLSEADINRHLVDMRNIIISMLQQKDIKDGKKFFQHAVVELTKILESYNE